MTTGILNAKHSGSATCAVLCKLSNGLILESGYSLTAGGVSRSAEYRRVTLAGANLVTMQHAEQNPGAPIVSTPFLRAGITVNVEEAFVDKWIKDHADSNIVRNKLVIKCKNLAEAQGMADADHQRKTGWEARSPNEMSAGKHAITKLEREDA